MIDFPNMDLNTADAIFTEARAFLDAPDPPSTSRWEQLLALDRMGCALPEGSERQRYLEQCRPYLIAKLDHGWPDHLRVLDFYHTSDEQLWLLGRVLRVWYDWSSMTRSGLEDLAKEWAKPHFARYTGLELGSLGARNLDPLLDALSDVNFQVLTSLRLGFGHDRFTNEGRYQARYDQLIGSLLTRWETSLVHLGVDFPHAQRHEKLAHSLIDRLAEGLPEMHALRWLEVYDFGAVAGASFEKLLHAIGSSHITHLSLRSLDDALTSTLPETLAREATSIQRIEDLLLDGLDADIFSELDQLDALAHVTTRRFFRETTAESWDDPRYKLTSDLDRSLQSSASLSQETLSMREMELLFFEDFRLADWLALVGDPDDPNAYNRLEYLTLSGIDEESFSIFCEIAPRAFPSLSRLDLTITFALREDHHTEAWPSLKSLTLCASGGATNLSDFVAPFPALEALEIRHTTGFPWRSLMNHPERVPRLRSLSICPSYDEDSWLDFIAMLRQSALLDQLDTIDMDFGYPWLTSPEFTGWINLALDDAIPLPIRQYIYGRVIHTRRNKADLWSLLNELDLPVKRSMTRAKLDAIYTSLFPEEIRVPYPDKLLDISTVTRFEISSAE